MKNQSVQAARRARRMSGFTLIEMVVVVAIIAILAAVIVPLLVSEVHRANVARNNAQMREIATAMQRYHVDMGNWPQGAGNWGGATVALASFAATDSALFVQPAGSTLCQGAAAGKPGACWGGPYLTTSNGAMNLAGATNSLGNAYQVTYTAAAVGPPATPGAITISMSAADMTAGGFAAAEIPNLVVESGNP